jgi:two-component system, OmpR family, response regulator
MNEQRPHLLIVDDDREIRGLLAQYLEKHDFRTTAVPDGRRCAACWSARTSIC